MILGLERYQVDIFVASIAYILLLFFFLIAISSFVYDWFNERKFSWPWFILGLIIFIFPLIIFFIYKNYYNLKGGILVIAYGIQIFSGLVYIYFGKRHYEKFGKN